MSGNALKFPIFLSVHFWHGGYDKAKVSGVVYEGQIDRRILALFAVPFVAEALSVRGRADIGRECRFSL
jgi:hypothetical protein